MMKKVFSIFCAFVMALAAADYADAVCAEGSNWTAAWSDSFGQTTYTLEAPCKAYIGIPFTITASATDARYPNDWVGFGWSILDNGVTIAGGGFNWITTVNGQWQRVLQQTYAGTPIDHLIQLKFTDMGQGGGGHGWKGLLTGDVTVDPLPIAVNSPPVVEAGSDIVVKSDHQTAVTIQGSTSDPDGDVLTYRWLEGTTVLLTSRQVVSSGNAPLQLAAIPPLSVGAHTLILEVSDGSATATDTMTVHVNDSPPIIASSCGGTYQVKERIALQGTVADYDGDTVTYRWMEGTEVLASGSILTRFGGAPVQLSPSILGNGLSLGEHIVILEVSDGIETVTENVSIKVVDTISPTLAPTTDTYILWPPNNKMREVVIKANAHDNSGVQVSLSVLVTSSQPPKKGKNGEIPPDVQIERIDQGSGTILLLLRAARSGKEGDRFYNVTISATDASGNESQAELRIKVPHDMGRF